MPSLSQFVQDEVPRLRRLAAALLADEAAADDVVQEVWLKSLEHKPSEFRDPRAWLTVVTRNLARNKRLSDVRRRDLERRSAGDTVQPDPLEGLVATSARVGLHEAVEALPEPVRSAIRLRFLEGLSLREVSARLGRPVPTLKGHLRRGLDTLRLRLDDEYGTRRAWSLGLVAAFDWTEEELRAAMAAGSAAAGTTGLATLGLSRTWGLVLVALATTLLVWFLWPRELERQQPAPVVVRGGLADSAEVRIEERPSPSREVAQAPEIQTDPATAPHTRVVVTVVDRTFQPVPYAIVRLTSFRGEAPREQGLTDDVGRLEVDVSGSWAPFPAESPNGVAVAFSAHLDGHARSSIFVLRAELAEDREVEIRLPHRAVRLHGRVIDAGGEPVPDARVFAGDQLRPIVSCEPGQLEIHTYPLESTTGPDGRYSIEGLPEGRLVVLAAHPAHEAAMGEVQGTGRDEAELNLELAPGGRVTGTVRDELGNPVVGAEIAPSFHHVLALHPLTTSDAQGRFRYEALPLGLESWLWARSHDGRTGRALIDLRTTATATADIEVSHRHRLTLRVENARGRPLAGAPLSIDDTDGGFHAEGRLDREGRYVLPDAAVDEVTVTVVDPRGLLRVPLLTAIVQVRPEEHVLVCDLPPDAEPAGARGVLLERDGSPPASGWVVAVERSTGGATEGLRRTDTGSFSFAGLVAGEYELLFDAGVRGVTSLATFEVDWGATAELGELTVPTGVVEVLREWPAEWTFDRSHLLLVKVSDTRPSVAARFDDLPDRLELLPGLWEVVLHPEGLAPCQRQFAVVPGGVTLLRLGPDSPGNVRVRATGADGHSAGGATHLIVRNERGEVVHDTPLFRGSAGFPLGPGLHAFEVTGHDGGGVPCSRTLSVGMPEDPTTLLLQKVRFP